jgi:hypothetical protein
MVTVPVYVPSYALSGDTHHVAVGDHVSWELAVIDVYLPDCLLALAAVHAVTETAQPVNPPYYWTSAMVGGSYVRRGSFVAWWEVDHPAGEEVQLRPVCAIGDSRLPDGGVPEASGVITRIYWALDLLRQRSDGPWERIPGVGLVEMDSTDQEPDQESTAYFPTSDTDATDGRWRHIGWIATLQCE